MITRVRDSRSDVSRTRDVHVKVYAPLRFLLDILCNTYVRNIEGKRETARFYVVARCKRRMASRALTNGIFLAKRGALSFFLSIVLERKLISFCIEFIPRLRMKKTLV